LGEREREREGSREGGRKKEVKIQIPFNRNKFCFINTIRYFIATKLKEIEVCINMHKSQKQ
jgi:hypothetical protein